ncbi:MAG: amidohydrolase family protein [Planctomyces sp.]|nr:amidohydrolase family protein [Planctomyces sp.]
MMFFKSNTVQGYVTSEGCMNVKALVSGMLNRRNLMTLLATAVLGASATAVSGSDVIPGAPQKKPVVLKNGVIHTVSGAPISDGMLIFDQGRITEIGTGLTIPADAEVIDLKGKDVWPSMIEAHSQIGLTEIASVRATIDYAETGSLNPNVSAHVAVNPDSELIPVTRANGVLIALSAPMGGLVSGKASVMQLDGWTYEDMTLKADAAMVVNWPRMTAPSFRGFRPQEAPSDEGGNQGLKSLRDLFDQARAYQKARSAGSADQRYDIRLEAMQPVIEGKTPLYVTANRVREIQSAVSFSAEQKVRMILFGGADAELCADLLKQHQIPVVIDSIHRLPSRSHEAYDSSYTLPERLRRAGVKFCISGSSRAETYNVRNLPYQAATAVAYGLPYEDGVRAVTIYPAEILGIADRVGTLDKGKDATLFVCDGDPLETDTQVEMAWVQGRRVDLNSRHRQLYEKYSEKYRQLKAAGK